MNFLDSHAHLMGEEFAADLDAVLERAEKAQVTRIMIITLSQAEAERALAFVDAHPQAGFSVSTGIFVDEAGTYTEDDWNRFERPAHFLRRRNRPGLSLGKRRGSTSAAEGTVYTTDRIGQSAQKADRRPQPRRDAGYL